MTDILKALWMASTQRKKVQNGNQRELQLALHKAFQRHPVEILGIRP